MSCPGLRFCLVDSSFCSDVTANISIRDRTRLGGCRRAPPTDVHQSTPSDMKSTLAVLLLCSPTSALQVGTKPTVSIALRVGTPPTASIIHAGKGMNQVALVELGSGCCHGTNSTKAAIRACNNAIEWNSVKVRTIIPGGYDAMMLHVHIAVPAPDTVDLDAVAACFPYGNLQPILVESGGMLGSSRANLPPDEPPDGLMTVACACVTIGFNEESDSTANAVESGVASQEPSPEAIPSPPPTSQSPPQRFEEKVARPAPTAAEMTPGSSEILARAKASKAAWSERVLTPLETFALIGDEDDIEIYDVRTHEQRKGHAINGRVGVTVKGATSLPLDDLVSGAAELPPSELPVVFVCSKGPKSLVTLDWLAERCPRAVCVEGGITAWDAAALPTDDV